MRVLYAMFFFTLSLVGSSQVIVDGVNINDLEHVQICQIVATGRLFSNKVTITIDYGQYVKWASAKGTLVRGEDGKMRKFNSVIDAINYMENNGWDYTDSHVITVETGFGSQNVYHYLFRRDYGFIMNTEEAIPTELDEDNDPEP